MQRVIARCARRSDRRSLVEVVIVALIAAVLVGCPKSAPPVVADKPPTEDSRVEPGPAPVEAEREPVFPSSPQPARPESTAGAPVSARPVEGWDLREDPAPGVRYRYVRAQAEGGFLPTVTVICTGERAGSPSEYAEKARTALEQQYPGVEFLMSEAVAGDWKPPLFRTSFTYASNEVPMRVMQVYAVREDGQVVVTTFTATETQWDYIQEEFRRILDAVTVAP